MPVELAPGSRQSSVTGPDERPSRNQALPAWARYGLALLIVAAATLARLMMNPWLAPDAVPYVTFNAAVALTAFLWGRGPGIAATLVGALASDYFVGTPPHSLLFNSAAELVPLGFFIATGLLVSLLAGHLHASRRHAQEQRQLLAVTLTSIGDGVIVTDPQGRVTFLNKQAEQLTGWTHHDAQGQELASVFHIVNETTRQLVESPVEKVLRLGTVVGLANHTVLIARDGREIPIDDSGAPIRQADGTFQGVVLVFRDFTERRQKEQTLQRLNRTLKARSSSNQALVRAQGESEYLEEVCRIVVEDCGHAMVWIGYAEEDEAKTVRPVASAGFDEGYVETLNISWADTQRGRGPTGTAIRTGQTNMCRNMLTDPRFAPWREQALQRGYASSLVLPLMNEGKAFGALTIYSRQADPFSDEEVKLLAELANDLEHGIRSLRLRVALRESQQHNEFLAGLIRDSSQPVGVGYPDGRLGLVNRAFEELTGYSAEELHSLDWAAVLTPPEWRAGEAEKLAELHRTGRPVRYEKEYLRKNGTRVPIELLVHLVPDAQGQPQYYYSFITDISQRKLAQEALRQSAERLRFAMEGIQAGEWELDLVDHTAHRSLLHDRVFGYETLLPQWTYEIFLEHVVPEDRPLVDQKFRQAVAAHHDWNFECRIIRADKAQRWIWASGRCQNDAAGQPRRLVGIVQDITDRKAAEEQFHLYLTVIQAAANAIVITGADGTIQWVNPAFTRLTGYTAAEALGQNPRVLKSGVQDPAFFKHMWETISSGRVWQGELVNRRKDGTNYSEEMTITPVTDATGKIAHYVAIKQDITRRKRAEEALRENRAKLDAALASMTDAVFISDTQGRFIEFNEAFATFHRFPSKEACAQTLAEYPDFLEVFLPDGKLAPLDQWAVPRALRGETVTNAEYALRRKDTGESWVGSYSFGPIRDPGGAIVGSVVVGRDVTELKRAEAALKESEQRFRTLADAIPQLAWTAHADGFIYWYNRRWYEYTGTTPKDMEGWGWQSVHDPAVLPKVLEQWRASIATGEPFDMTFPLRGADGRFRPFLTRVRPLKDAQGRVLQWFGTNTDVEELKRAQEAQALLAAIVESSHDAILSKGLDGTILSWNAGAQRLLGYRADEIIGRPITVLMPPEYVPEEEQIIARLRRGERCEPTETVRLTKDGRRIDVAVTVSPLLDQGGHVVGASKVIHDITQRKQAKQALQRTAEELARSNKDLEQFAYVASHDLQEPLRMVTGYLQLIDRRYKDKLDQDAREFIAFAVDGATRMSRLITDLLDYSRINSRAKPPEPVGMEAVLQRALDNLQASMRDTDAQITHDPLPTVLGDASQLVQLFQNLVGNALKFRAPERPVRVCIRAEKKDDEWIFSIQDDGIGIEPQYAGKIFLIFQRLHTRAAYPGTGIGLALCKKIVERHGGRIWFESVPGRGATFFFTLGGAGVVR